MYSESERKKAIELFIKYDKRVTQVIHELGYPTRQSLYLWYKDYLKTGVVCVSETRATKYSPEQKRAAVAHWLEHGRCFARTIKALGYPGRTALQQWCRESAPDMCKQRKSVVQLNGEQKKNAVVELCAGNETDQKIALRYGTSRTSVRRWKKELLGEGRATMPSKERTDIPDDKDALVSEIESLKAQIYRLSLERDILEGTVEILKKDPGVDPARLSNREKATLIDALRNRHSLTALLASLEIAKSSYFYQSGTAKESDKYEACRIRIHEIFDENGGRYGYRRIHALLVREDIRISEKIVRRIMQEDALEVFTKKNRKYNSYKGEVTPAVENLLERDFHADKPNLKWLTDITEFHIPAGKIYLSPVIDCFDGLAVSWTVGTSPDANLVNEMLDSAAGTLGDGEHPVVHSDRGGHYRWPGWIERMERYGLTRSMSKKGCSPDNSACEGFFGRLKNEMFYGRSWQGVETDEFIDMLDEYMHWYNESRIKMSLSAMSPVEYRRSLGLAA
jgi:transposase InsO family protein/transposase-like protein